MFKNLFFFLIPGLLLSQSIEVISFNENPVEVNPLIGADLTINYKYTSESGSTGNHIYIALEILDSGNNYQSTVADITLENQTAGTNITGSVEFFIGSSNKLSADLDSGLYYQVKTILYAGGGWSANAWSGNWDTPSITLQDTSGVTRRRDVISKGVDISWMSEMESDGYVWKDNYGTTKELMPLLTEYQIDAVRLRVWVDPSVSDANGWCDIDDMVAKAKLADAEGKDILVCIHYSDWWADPGQQTLPAAWVNYSVAQLETAVYNHATDILIALDAENITPKWVQIGNETSNGMLWPTGKASTAGFVNYAKFINAGYNAIKDFDSTIKAVVHIAGAQDNGLYQWNIGRLVDNGAQFDVIAMSLYPDASSWKSDVDATYANMMDMQSRYGKEVMIAEVGFSSNRPDIGHQFLVYMLERAREANCLGVFYWEPIAHGDFTSYSKGAWDSDGSPSIAMDAYIDDSVLNVNNLKSIKKNKLHVYPNPVLDELKITLKKDYQIKTIQITDELGRNIKTIYLKNKEQIIDFYSFSSGMYFLITNTKESVVVVKN
jgi:arabinogalactan endo-1,4-beta-galactosidase